MPVDDLLALRYDVGLGDDAIGQVGSIERADGDIWRSQSELFEDIVANFLSGCCGQGHDRGVREVASEFGQLSVFGSKIVSPLRHAVGFVDGDHVDLVALKQVGKVVLQSSFGRGEEQAELLVFEFLEQVPFFLMGGARVPTSRRDPQLQQSVDLVFHQRDQGADDDRASAPVERGSLVAEGFPPSGGHDDQCIALAEGCCDRFFLGVSEL